jgi:hypothetical protein
MKALSVRAPWWYAILHLGKDIENRDWHTNFRGVVMLHAGKHWKQSEIESDFEDIRIMAGQKDLTLPSDILGGCGCIVGSVEIVDCVNDSDSPWFMGEYGFVLRHPIAYRTPIPFKGALGFFDVPDNFLASPRHEPQH